MHASIRPAAEHVPCTAAIVTLRKSRMRTSLSKYMVCSCASLPSGVSRMRRPVLLAREQLLQVVAGREVLALGREHDDAHVGVGVGPVERGVELVDQPAVLRVGRFGPGERDRRDRTVDRVRIVSNAGSGHATGC